MAPGAGTGTPVLGVSAPWERTPFFSAVWVWDNSASVFVDNTTESQIVTGTAFTIFDATADYIYFGSQSRFDMAVFTLATVGSVGVRTWQYWNGSAWTRFIPGVDYGFTTIYGAEKFDNLVNWSALAFSNGTPHPVAPPDTTARYWVRCSVASISSSPTVNRIQARPYAAYCTATDVANLLQLDADFSTTTTPTRNTIEDYIHAAQAYIDFKTYKTWRLGLKEQEHHEFSMTGFALIEREIQAIVALEIWNGMEWETKTEGRTNDYFFVPDMGMVYFSRYFMMPARLQSYNAPVWKWGWAEFTYPVRVTYIYGKNIFTSDREGMQIWDITRKQTAIDVITATDFGMLAVSGSDKVTLDRKAEIWRVECEDRLESLRRWIIM